MSTATIEMTVSNWSYCSTAPSYNIATVFTFPMYPRNTGLYGDALSLIGLVPFYFLSAYVSCETGEYTDTEFEILAACPGAGVASNTHAICTTEGFGGGCPPGYDPYGGMCCTQATESSCNALGYYWDFMGNACSQNPPGEVGGGDFGLCDMGCSWSFTLNQCVCNSPVLIDVNGDGFALTDVAGGVLFDLNRDGVEERLAWTAVNTDDSWLTLDRNGNGLIDDGAELFGNYTPQPEPPTGQQKNGFLALVEFDKSAQGGNGDDLIDARDAVFSSLRLWRDANHDGVSQPAELHTLAGLGLSSIDPNYKESERRDRYGNRFRYRAKVHGNLLPGNGRWAYDVFLLSGR